MIGFVHVVPKPRFARIRCKQTWSSRGLRAEELVNKSKKIFHDTVKGTEEYASKQKKRLNVQGGSLTAGKTLRSMVGSFAPSQSQHRNKVFRKNFEELKSKFQPRQASKYLQESQSKGTRLIGTAFSRTRSTSSSVFGFFQRKWRSINVQRRVKRTKYLVGFGILSIVFAYGAGSAAPYAISRAYLELDRRKSEEKEM
mmetsp:Transcript_8833/g.10104  ORF Transcript_8833/g.10104 Transcript_8833/m.10104 type:complete len:198 (+) Transcript_8833:128-721(+)